MIEPIWFLWGLGLPMVVGGVWVWFLARGRDKLTSPLPAIGWSLGIGLGAAIGMLALLGTPPWKPIEAHHWVLIAVLPAGVGVGLITAIPRLPKAVYWLLRLIVSVGTAWAIMQSQLSRWTTTQACVWLGGLGAGVFIVWALMQCYAQRNEKKSDRGGSGEQSGGYPAGRAVVFVLGATAGALGGCTLASGSIIGGQLTVSLAGAIGGGWLATLGRNAGPNITRGAVDVLTPPIFGLLIYGWHFAWQMRHPVSVHIVAGLLALAPLGLFASSLPWIKTRSARQRTVLGLAVSALLITAAVGLAGYEAYLRSQGTEPGYY